MGVFWHYFASLLVLSLSCAAQSPCSIDFQVNDAFYNRFDETNVILIANDHFYEFNLQQQRIVRDGKASRFWPEVKFPIAMAASRPRGVTFFRVNCPNKEFGLNFIFQDRHYWTYECKGTTYNCTIRRQGFEVNSLNRLTDSITAGMFLQRGMVIYYLVNDSYPIFEERKKDFYIHIVTEVNNVHLMCSLEDIESNRDITNLTFACVIVNEKQLKYPSFVQIRKTLGHEGHILGLSARHDRKKNVTDFVVLDRVHMYYTENGHLKVLNIRRQIFACSYIFKLVFICGITFSLIGIMVVILGTFCYSRRSKTRTKEEDATWGHISGEAIQIGSTATPIEKGQHM